MNLNLLEVLQSVGLTENEAKVYLALLHLGESIPGKIAQQAKVKRPTTYAVLNQLWKKDFIGRRNEGTKELFRAVSPYKVLETQQIVLSNLESVIPQLLALNKILRVSPNYSIYTGHKGMEEVWLDSLNSSTDILYWADDNLSEIVYLKERRGTRPEDFEISYVDRRIEKGIWVRGIIPYEQEQSVLQDSGLEERQKEYLSLKKEGAARMREYCFIPKGKWAMEMEVHTYDDKIVLLSYKDLFSAVIQSEALARIFRQMFMLALHYARETEKYLLSEKDKTYLEI